MMIDDTEIRDQSAQINPWQAINHSHASTATPGTKNIGNIG